jgi:predicted deacetylase
MARYIIRFDDFFVGMERRSLHRIAEYLLADAIPAIIGVVPAWQDDMPVSEPVGHDELWETVRTLQEHGCEIALHGCYHKLFAHRNLLQVNNYGEFAGLDFQEQKARLQLGLEVFAAQKVACRMFMPPAHSFDLNTIRALREVGIPLVTDGKSFYPFLWDGVLFLPQISSDFREFRWGLITICLHPQWMTDELYARLAAFCRSRPGAIVSVQQGVDGHEARGALARGTDRVVRGLYRLRHSR